MKQFDPGDKLVIGKEYAEIESILPHITCKEAQEYADAVRQNRAGGWEIFQLGIHLVHIEREHEPGCPFGDTELTERVKRLGRGDDEQPHGF